MKYSIIKDSKPKDTINRILTILKQHNINIEIENTGQGKNFSSCRVSIKGQEKLGSNGKGTCEENSIASGLAEFMERLQAQFILKLDGELFFGYTDSKICNINEINPKIINNIDILNKNFILNSKAALFKNIRNELNSEETLVSSFVSYKNKNIHYLPISIITSSQGSNGFAAGNTYEEACTQALSEIIERYCTKEIYTKQIHMPEIPKKYWEKYENLKNLIKEIENKGYKITIKDASLGKNFPTVCCIFEDLKYLKNGVCIKFGTHPYFPIALERTLTEFMQGYKTLDDERFFLKFLHLTKFDKLEKILHESTIRKSFFAKNIPYIQHILSDKKDYFFDKKTWLFNKKNNKFLFNKLSKLILKQADDIYIKNHTFLNFPTVQIYIPKMSNPLIENSDIQNKWLNVFDWINYIEKDIPFENKSLDNLINACLFLGEYVSNTIEPVYNFGIFQARYLGFHCAIIKKNKKLIRKFIRLILNEQILIGGLDDNLTLRFYQAFKKYFKLYFKKVAEEKIKEEIENKYTPEIYQMIKNTLINLNYSQETLFKILKEEQPSENTLKNNEYIKEIKKNLHKFYFENPPNQNEIIKIITHQTILSKIFKKICNKK